MFGKQKEKESATSKPAAASEKPAATTAKAAPAKKPSGIASMFAKQAAAGPVVKKTVVKKEEESDEDEKMSPINSPGKENRMNQVIHFSEHFRTDPKSRF